MNRPTRPNNASIPPEPFNPGDESSESDRSRHADAFTSVYGGTSATLEYGVAAKSREQKISSGQRIENSAIAPNPNWSPSLQNVLDQPPATLPLRMLLGGMTFCLAFGAWAMVGQIEEVGHAGGHLVPKGQSYKINPVIPGKIARIAVKEGETVQAGQVLVEIDNKIAVNEVERLEKERSGYQTQRLQTQTLIDQTRLEAPTHAAMAEAKAKAQDAMLQQAGAKVEAVREQITQAQKKADTIVALLLQQRSDADALNRRREAIKSLTNTVSLRQQELQQNVEAGKARLQRLEPLVKEGAIARERLYEAEQALRDRISAITQTELQEAARVREQIFEADRAIRDRHRSIIQTEGDLKQATEELDRLQAELKQAQAEQNRLVAEQQQIQAEMQAVKIQNRQKIQQLEVQKTQLQAKVDEAEKLIAKANTELKQLVVTAPTDGTILALNVRNPGEVVQPGQIIAQMAPEDAPLVLLAKLPDREAGFIKTGMDVKVKFDSYPYQDYGIVSGKVTSIAPDATPDPQLGAVYQVEISLERHNVKAEKQTIAFKAGQTATADIIIRRRRIIDVLLDPIRKMQKSGIEM
jgi:hemolysin D